MRSVVVPGTSLGTSRLGFGTASLHHLHSSRARQDLMARAWSAGIRYFDTAPLYGHELAERELGRFVQGRRGEMVLTTKVGLLPNAVYSRSPTLMRLRAAAGVLARRAGWPPGRRPMPGDFDPATVLKRVDGSLARLRTDHVDVLYLHEPSLEGIQDLDGLRRVLEKIQKTGRARWLGLAGNARQCLALAEREPSLGQVLQVEVDRSPGAGIEVLRTALRTPQVTFGHLRSALGHATFDLTACLAQASADNPDGVILFSSRSALHLKRAAECLDDLER